MRAWIIVYGAAALITSGLTFLSRSWKLAASIGCAGFAILIMLQTSARAQQDYPTVAIADYVFGCMASNGQTREALEKCSCSIDVIASILSYDDYVQAETFARMRLLSGEKGTLFRSGVKAREMTAALKRAQAEAEVRCF
jgi:hypothetical protein